MGIIRGLDLIATCSNIVRAWKRILSLLHFVLSNLILCSVFGAPKNAEMRL